MSEIEKMYELAGIRKINDCCHLREHYPPFTAEKQIELIKWFMHSRHFSSIRFNARWVVDNIASYTNYIWQDLTEEEKQQVKGILE